MTCRRAYDAELLALVHGEGDAELRAHVDGCADCAAELRVWRELDGILQAGVPPPASHPEPEALVAFVDAPASLAPDVRAGLERHLATCRPCADEIRALGGFAATAIAAPADVAPADVRAAAPTGGVHVPRIDVTDDESPRAPGRVTRVLWHPAFAYALVVLLLVPLVRDQLPKLSYETRAVDDRRAVPSAGSEERAAAPAPPAPPAALQAPVQSKGALVRDEADGVRYHRKAEGAAAADAGRQDGALGSLNDRTEERRAERPAAPSRRSADRTTDAASEVERPADAGPAPAAEPERARTLAAPAAKGQEESPETLPALGFGAPGAAASGRTGLLVLELPPQKPTVFAAEVIGRPAQLRIGPPADLARGPLTVTLRGRANRRELTVLGMNDANAIAIAIPADFLAPGDYVVTLQPVKNGLEPAAPPALMGFAVHAPTAR